jgi:hypothetical protein
MITYEFDVIGSSLCHNATIISRTRWRNNFVTLRNISKVLLTELRKTVVLNTHGRNHESIASVIVAQVVEQI